MSEALPSGNEFNSIVKASAEFAGSLELLMSTTISAGSSFFVPFFSLLHSTMSVYVKSTLIRGVVTFSCAYDSGR